MSPSKRISLILRRRSVIEDQAARQQLRLLRSLREEMLRELAASTSAARRVQVHTMLAVVDQEIARGMVAAQAAISTTTSQVLGLATDMTGRATLGAQGGLYGLSQSLIRAALDFMNDTVRSVWSDVGSKVKLAIRRVVFGISDQFEATKAVAKLLRNDATFRAPFARADQMVRTGVNQVFSTSTADRMAESDRALQQTGERLAKWWLPVGDDRTRHTHELAGQEYAKDKAIPLHKAFWLKTPKGDREPLMFPLDPRASAANTQNCRCVQVGKVVTADEYARMSRAS